MLVSVCLLFSGCTNRTFKKTKHSRTFANSVDDGQVSFEFNDMFKGTADHVEGQWRGLY